MNTTLLFIISIAAVTAAVYAVLCRQQILALHLQLNSRLDAYLVAVGQRGLVEGRAAGVEAERLRAEGVDRADRADRADTKG